jgi:D-serine deaminase-like pyridoxal phosphate-dependent protein
MSDPAPAGSVTVDGAGGVVRDLPGPALIVDLAAVERNAALMGNRIAALGVSLRPHIKAHKCAELARIQLRHGAVGVTTATAAEAAAMVEAGIEDVFVANQVVDLAGLAALAAAARGARVAISVDDPHQVDLAGQAAEGAGSTIEALIEVDVGMGRCGVRSPEQVVPLARAIEAQAGLRLGGICGYEGHCVDEPDRALRQREVGAAAARLSAATTALEAEGFEVGVVSAGGTGTYDMAAAKPVVTELQAGSYLLMDGYHAAVTPEFEQALSVLASVIARHGDLIVIDAGRKAISSDLAPLRLLDHEAEMAFSHEEHSGFRVRGEGPEIGERVRVVPGYAPSTVNLYGRLWLAEGDTVVESCRVRARHGEP